MAHTIIQICILVNVTTLTLALDYLGTNHIAPTSGNMISCFLHLPAW